MNWKVKLNLLLFSCILRRRRRWSGWHDLVVSWPDNKLLGNNKQQKQAHRCVLYLVLYCTVWHGYAIVHQLVFKMPTLNLLQQYTSTAGSGQGKVICIAHFYQHLSQRALNGIITRSSALRPPHRQRKKSQEETGETLGWETEEGSLTQEGWTTYLHFIFQRMQASKQDINSNLY